MLVMYSKLLSIKPCKVLIINLTINLKCLIVLFALCNKMYLHVIVQVKNYHEKANEQNLLIQYIKTHTKRISIRRFKS